MKRIELGEIKDFNWIKEGAKMALNSNLICLTKKEFEKDVLGASTSMIGWALTGGSSFGPWGALGGFIAGTVFGAVSGSLIS